MTSKENIPLLEDVESVDSTHTDVIIDMDLPMDADVPMVAVPVGNTEQIKPDQTVFDQVETAVPMPNGIIEKMCWICHDTDRPEQMFSPCRCDGSVRYVHVDCLNHWRASSNNPEALNQCMSCNYTYRLSNASNPPGKVGKCNIYLSNNPLCFYLLNQIWLMILAVVIRLIDNRETIVWLFENIHHGKKSQGGGEAGDEAGGDGNGSNDGGYSVLFDENFSDYYLVAVIFYLIIVVTIFLINLIRLKHRRLYLKTFSRIGTGWWCILICVLIVANLLSIFVGTIILTILIQMMIKLHYHYLGALNQAQENRILAYDPRLDITDD